MQFFAFFLVKKKEIVFLSLIYNSVGRRNMFHIDEAEINQIRESADIVEIVKSYITLTQKGKNYFGVCPFHNDHAPSMSVSSEKGIYKCFSCGATGNVFKFVSDFENISFAEAVKRVAEKIGVTLKSQIVSKNPKKNTLEHQIMDFTCLFFQNNLMTERGLEAKKYLIERQLKEEDIKEFQIGLSLDKNGLFELLKTKKYEPKKLLDLGLINQNGLNYHDIFVNRIMFPIHNLTGEVVGFTGRSYIKDSAPPKYINSKETMIFKKGNILFNYHRASSAVRLEKKLIIVEGNMDAIRMYSSGIKNTIALMGTSLTSVQIQEIKKLRVPVVLILDNDNAGNMATYQNGLLLEKEGINVLVVRLSGEKDPDEYIIKHGVEAMKDNIKQAISFLEFKLSYLKQNKNLQDGEGLATYIKEVLEGMKESNDPILKEVTLKKMSDDYGLSMEVLREELAKLSDKEEIKVLPSLPVEEAKKKKNKFIDGVNHILYFMMNDTKYIFMFKSKLGFFRDSIPRGISNEILAYYELHKSINLADFLTFAEKSKLKKEIYEIIESIKDENMNEEIMEEYIIAVKKSMKEQEIKELKEKLKIEMDSNKKLTIALRIQNLKKEV